MISMNDHEQCLTDGDRLKRIGDILCAAILAHCPPMCESEGVREGDIEQDRTPLVGRRGMTPEDRVLDYLSKVGEASPAILRTVIHLPRTSAYRVINGLVETGRIRGTGQTRTLVYRLGSMPPHQQNVEGN